MFRIVFILLTAPIVLAAAAAAYVFWIATSSISAQNVETRFYQGCMVAYAVQTTSPSKMRNRPLSSSICSCFSTKAVDVLGVAQATQLAERLRQSVLETIKARITGGRPPDIHTPEARMLVVQLEQAGTSAYNMCAP
ncbi:MAG: hypothetical protein KDJ29_02165 [Hyphomicrobiales bacterium]|nr:hypothetical protein [Hyphomicrobiales bacterium]